MSPPLRERLRWRWQAYLATPDATPNPRFRVTSTFYLFVAGATISLLGLLLPDPTRNEAGIVATACSAYAIALVVLLTYDRLSLAMHQVLSICGTILVSLIVLFSGGGDSVFALFYLWVVLFAIYFFTTRQVILQLTVIAVLYGTVLALTDSGTDGITRWATLLGTFLVAWALVGLLKVRGDRLVARLADAARTDALTGLLNRRGFQEVFELELERARRSDRPVAIALVDLDHFKRVNDRLGHAAGDSALERTAGVLREAIRRIDTPARVGGEEFAVLLPEIDSPGAYAVAERLRSAVERAFGNAAVPLTASVGIVTFPEHGRSGQELLQAGDRALYAAKELGRNRSVIASDEADRLAASLEPLGGQRGVHLETLVMLAETLDLRDPSTAQHSHTVGRLAELMARELGLPPVTVERVRLAGILHDIGKIGVSDAALRKPGPLNEHEWTDIRRHPELAGRILAGPQFADLREWIVAHHERPDGRGYPRGLGADEIPLEARILAVADAYEAMTSERVYRKPLGAKVAQRELRRRAGTQFDAEVVDALMRALERSPAPAVPGARPPVGARRLRPRLFRCWPASPRARAR